MSGVDEAAVGVRRLLAEADRERAVARWADNLCCSIRLGRPIKVSEMHQRGPFGRKRKYMYDLDDRMPHEAVDGLYRALHIVRHEAEARASEIEARVTNPATPTDHQSQPAGGGSEET